MIYEIYGLECLCHPEEGIRYVGMTSKGRDRRLQEHIWEAQRTPTVAKHFWIAKHGPTNIVSSQLETTTELADLADREIFWIGYLKSQGFELLNLTIGGEGRLGYTASEDAKKKMSLAKKGKSTGARSAEVKDKISQGVRKSYSSHIGERPRDSKSKLTYEDAKNIRQKNLAGTSQRSLSREYGISLRAVQNILNNITYRQT